MTPNTLTKVYVSLDSLLDTRLGTLALINADFCFDVTTHESYFKREEDSFKSEKMGTLSKTVFNDVLNSRKQEVIRNSLRTKIHVFIREVCATLLFQSMSTPFQSGVEIDVNTYPYTFSEEEIAPLLQSISVLLGKDFSINLINKSNEQLDISYVREHYRCMVMYNYYEWINMYETEIKKKPLRDTGFYVPRLYFGKLPSEAELQNFAEHNTDPFSFSKQILAPLVVIQYLPISLFCADTPDNKSEYSKI